MAYKNNPLDDIVKCTIEISSPASSDATFDSILVIVPGPKSPGERIMEKTTAISKADELLDYGFTVEDTAYLAVTAAFSQNPSPDELYICIRKEIPSSTNGGTDNAVGSTETEDIQDTSEDTRNIENSNDNTQNDTDGTQKEKESTKEVSAHAEGGTIYESITSTLARANSEAGFYGIHITEFKEPDDVMAAIAWTEANEKLFAFEYDDYNNCPVKNFSYYRSFCMYSGNADGYEPEEQPTENRYAALAWMAKCFGYDPGTETWHLKELATIVPSALSTDQKKQLEQDNINTFLRYAGCSCTIGGRMLAGEWIDVIRFRDWLKAEMQIRVFNVLKANRKVPFTDNGIGLIEGAMERVLKDGQDIGGIAPTEYDEDANPIYGFRVFVPRAMNLTEAQRKSRKLPNCRYTARLAGAIHAVEIEGFLTF